MIDRFWQLVLADWRERTRRYSYLVMLAFIVFFGFLVINGKYGVYPGKCRGVPTSAWVGGVMATATTWLMMLVGFYLVKTSVRRDRLTGVGQILATTSLSNCAYLFAKAISNALTLTSMMVVLLLAALVMQLTGSLAWELHPWQLVAPFLFITLPIIFVVSSLAVLFEVIRPLSGAIGNFVYFFLATQFMTTPLMVKRPLFDPIGINLVTSSMSAAARAVNPEAGGHLTMGFVSMTSENVAAYPLFRWEGIDWTLDLILPRLGYLLFAAVIITVATPFFDRFSGVAIARQGRRKRNTDDSREGRTQASKVIAMLQILSVPVQFNFLTLLIAETRLLLRRLSWKWHIVTLGLIVAQLLVPYPVLKQYIVPAAMVWPLVTWSSMGAREKMFGTESLVFSSVHPLSRQLPAQLVAGVLVSLVAICGALMRALVAGETAYFAALGSAALFIPAMAFTLGALSGGNQLFEILYVFLWYLGPVNHLPALDYLAAAPTADAGRVAIVVLLFTLFLLPIAYAVRMRQLRR
ncbi:MAG TPA: hypothetical protein VMS71_02490 [Candidatus Acidoferrum sp.]|nr:hypothetical protein [Candidatus Acidoferrum sp.]